MMTTLNTRNEQETGDNIGGAVFTTTDLGETWTEHASSHNALQEPVCMGSLHRHGKYLLFSNPDDTHQRNNLRITWSDDEGNTWNNGPVVNSGVSFGYSCLTSVNESTIGILWEGTDAQMMYKAIPLEEILQYNDKK